ncbi:CIS tube protein [Sphaerisporangium rhizosphaerae]|uniref:LysM peptidoglycan-binding domain-containing protein n=1 Tax=Sphaerisporangium rhizosphaerae TaxID=2269375 RepID=A0ABW2PE45_9ACTN
MPQQALTITPLDAAGRERTDRKVTVAYNPEEFTLGKDNNFAVQGIPGLGAPLVQFVNGNQRTLEVELLFDTYDTAEMPKQDVRRQTGPLARFMELDSDLHAPPILIVAMAGFRFRCVLTRISQKFVLLMPDGTPVRAKVGCTFAECLDLEQEAKAANLQTADFTKAHVVLAGETISSIAAELYGDPRMWRPIALANGLADPRLIAPGDTLLVPALPYTNPATLEVET